MKTFLFSGCLFIAIALSAQNNQGKTGIIEYGNPSLLYVPKSSAANAELWTFRPGYLEIAFSDDEENFYVKNPENYIYTQNPEKRTLTAWNLISQKKENLDIAALPLTRKGREILSLFTSHYPVAAYRSNKKINEWQCWLSGDLRLVLNDKFSVKIYDTTSNVVADIKMPDYLSGINLDAFKGSKEKPRNYDIDYTFCYYPKNKKLYISGDCGKYGKGYNRLWQYDMGTGTLTEIPFFTTDHWNNGNGLADFGKASVSFTGNYIVRKYFTSNKQISYEFISPADGILAGGGTLQTEAEEGQDNRVLAFLPERNEIIVLNNNLQYDVDKRRYRIIFYDTSFKTIKQSVTFDVGKADWPGNADEFPVCVSKEGKFYSFAGLFKHPEIGVYLSVNYDMLEDAGLGYINSINDIAIHEPLIKENYATTDFTRTAAAIQEKIKAVEKLKKEMEETLSMIKNSNDELLAQYRQNNLYAVLTNAAGWKIDRASFTWEEPAPQGVLNGPTTYSFGVSYDIKFYRSSAPNYVDMQCKEVAEAYKNFSHVNREENVYGESYFAPASGSHTLVRNPNYTTSTSYLTFDKPELSVYLDYLKKSTRLFTGNSFEVTTQDQLGIPIVVLKYPYRNNPKNSLYLYQQDILEWVHKYDGQLKRLNTLKEEMGKVGQ